jgi:pimeloyl-ACP methyl ester carboxylesterase
MCQHLLWGENDLAFVMHCSQGIEVYVADCRILCFPNASHWLQHELPNAVNQEIADFIGPLN